MNQSEAQNTKKIFSEVGYMYHIDNMKTIDSDTVPEWGH